ncbi:hypothetical protein [Amycolatopsis sp. CA-230715]|uniref:hypothetical protein n=1 Tax=Amycolatopsis sp. CA-230715 TaxID=2745196 RepID=UPI001C00E1EC|nr:hypothetical protein [Amycolatopsis sp. CA-230715]QWF78815.1 hypothetical protein HUW46_02213 [Amycolatopsis sp. CA-230715]
MTTVERRTDPVDDYLAALAAAVHGPAKVKARMLEEIRGGLEDAVSAQGGDSHAAALALRDFGTVEEVASSCQTELTIAQTRHTSRALALTVPFLLACWYLIRTASPSGDGQVARVAQLVAAHLTGAATIAAVLAAAALAATGTLARWLPTPPKLPRVVAWTSTSTGAAMAVATVALLSASPASANWPLVVLAGLFTAASHAMVAGSARACRECARLTC